MVSGIIPGTILGSVNGKNTQSEIHFLKLNLQNSFFTLTNKPRFKASNVVMWFSFSSIPFFFLSFLVHKNMFPEVL